MLFRVGFPGHRTSKNSFLIPHSYPNPLRLAPYPLVVLIVQKRLGGRCLKHPAQIEVNLTGGVRGQLLEVEDRFAVPEFVKIAAFFVHQFF